MGARILIVEDEIIGAMYLRHTLDGLGYEVVGIEETAEAAVTCALESRPDLVVMDVRLKGEMDGVTAAKLLREQAGIPSIFVSAYTGKELRNRYAFEGEFPLLSKPVLESTLREVVSQVLESGKRE